MKYVCENLVGQEGWITHLLLSNHTDLIFGGRGRLDCTVMVQHMKELTPREQPAAVHKS